MPRTSKSQPESWAGLLQDALFHTRRPSPDCKSAPELAVELEIDVTTARRWARKLVSLGQLESVAGYGEFGPCAYYRPVNLSRRQDKLAAQKG